MHTVQSPSLVLATERPTTPSRATGDASRCCTPWDLARVLWDRAGHSKSYARFRRPSTPAGSLALASWVLLRQYPKSLEGSPGCGLLPGRALRHSDFGTFTVSHDLPLWPTQAASRCRPPASPVSTLPTSQERTSPLPFTRPRPKSALAIGSSPHSQLCSSRHHPPTPRCALDSARPPVLQPRFPSELRGRSHLRPVRLPAVWARTAATLSTVRLMTVRVGRWRRVSRPVLSAYLRAWGRYTSSNWHAPYELEHSLGVGVSRRASVTTCCPECGSSRLSRSEGHPLLRACSQD
ncbi:hypothetical protein BC628DRAFT_1122812 [Trametes gibbosa]|nr:hypothetical protein BC628DRAFT_1122812 [Trametes gibbosa]